MARATKKAAPAASAEVKSAPSQDRLVQMSSMCDDFMLKMLQMFDAEEFYTQLRPQIESRLKEEFGVIPQVHKVELPDVEHKFTGTTHEMFDTVLKLVSLKLPVYMEGPAGTGKNVIAKQIAEGLGLEFYFTNAVTQEHKLTGFIDANGNFHETQFYKAFSQGGLFFLDEMDASIPEVLIILNAAIANGYFDFPIGKIEAHPNFRVIAAGNTLGTGADNQYTGRYCLDRASLDRFAILKIDYSPAIEAEVCDSDSELMDYCHAFRAATAKSGIQCVFSYRSLHRIHTLEQANFDIPTILRMALIKDLDKDDVAILYKEMSSMLPAANRFLKGMAKMPV